MGDTCKTHLRLKLWMMFHDSRARRPRTTPRPPTMPPTSAHSSTDGETLSVGCNRVSLELHELEPPSVVLDPVVTRHVYSCIILNDLRIKGEVDVYEFFIRIFESKSFWVFTFRGFNCRIWLSSLVGGIKSWWTYDEILIWIMLKYFCVRNRNDRADLFWKRAPQGKIRRTVFSITKNPPFSGHGSKCRLW